MTKHDTKVSHYNRDDELILGINDSPFALHVFVLNYRGALKLPIYEYEREFYVYDVRKTGTLYDGILLLDSSTNKNGLVHFKEFREFEHENFGLRENVRLAVGGVRKLERK